MKLEIKDRKRNPLMKREDILITIKHEGKATPNRAQLMEDAAKLLKTRKENLVVNRIITAAGSTVSEAKLFSYSKKDDIPEWRLKKMEARMSKKKAEAPAEKPASEEAKPEAETTQESQKEESTAPSDEGKEEKPAEPAPDGKAEAPKEEAKTEGEDTQRGASKPPEKKAEAKEESKPSAEGKE